MEGNLNITGNGNGQSYCDLLNKVTEDLFLLDGKFSLIAEKYNNLHSPSDVMNYKRLELAWIVYHKDHKVSSWIGIPGQEADILRAQPGRHLQVCLQALG